MNTTEPDKKPKTRVLFPIGLKLMIIVTLIIAGSSWIIILLNRLVISAELARTADATNFDINSRAAAGIRDRLYGMRSLTVQLLDMASTMGDSPATRQIRNIFFERNPGIAAVTVPGVTEMINRQFFAASEIPLETFSAWLAGETDAIGRASRGEPVLLNVSPVFGLHLLALFYPWQGAGRENAAVTLFSPGNLAEITGIGSNSTVLVNGSGDVLIHPDFSQVLAGANIADSPLVDHLWKATDESVRLSYTVGGNRFVGAGHRVPFAGTAVFSSLEYSVITQQAAAATKRNIFLSLTVLSLAVLVTWFYARSVVAQLKKLKEATEQIESGDFKLDLKHKTRDEIGTLTEQFVHMSHGLDKWVKAKTLVGRYDNQEISDRVIAGKLNLQGVYLDAAILSVDLVSFDEISRGLDAEESLELLNFFAATVTGNVERSGGVVDKVMGTRLIAHWGILDPGDLTEMVMNSLRSALLVRAELWDINTDRETAGKGHLRIGCGIHAGKVLAGSIGTPHCHEYSVAGSVLTQASLAGKTGVLARTDIAITKAVREMADSRILAEELTPAQPDSGDAQFFGLVNLTPSGDHERQHWPFTLDEVREALRRGRKNQAAKN